MDNPFSWDYLTAPLSDMATFGPLSVAFLALLIGTIVVAVAIYFGALNRYVTDPLLRRGLNIASQWMLWLCGIGLFFFAWRLMRIDFISLYMRVWSYLTLIAYLASVGYFVYWRFRVYPRKIAEQKRARELRRYMPPRSATPKRARR